MHKIKAIYCGNLQKFYTFIMQKHVFYSKISKKFKKFSPFNLLYHFLPDFIKKVKNEKICKISHIISQRFHINIL